MVMLGDTSCEMLDLSDDDPHWRYIAQMNRKHYGEGVVIEKKIYVLGGIDDTCDEVYDAEQGILMDIFKFRPSSNKRSSISVL